MRVEVGKEYDNILGDMVYIAFDLRTIGYTGGYPLVGYVREQFEPSYFTDNGSNPLSRHLLCEHREPEVIEGFAIGYNRSPSNNGCVKVSTNTYDTPENAWRHSGLFTERGKLFRVVMTEVI